MLRTKRSESFLVSAVISIILQIPTPLGACVAKPGDANGDGAYTLSDAIAIVNFVFNQPGCSPVPTCWVFELLCRGDWNGDGLVTLADVIEGVSYIFNKSGGPWNPMPSDLCSEPTGIPAGDVLQISDNWTWTQDGRGGGSQSSLSIREDSIVIQPVNHVHFVNTDSVIGNGVYAFRFKGGFFSFAWKISPQSSSQGTGLVFQSEGVDRLSLIHVDWSGFYYGWHNAGGFRNIIEFPFATDTWHEVLISDTGVDICIIFDGIPLNLFDGTQFPVENFLSDVVPGYVGIGEGSFFEVKYQDFKFIQ